MIERSQLKFPAILLQDAERVLDEMGLAAWRPELFSKLGITEEQFRSPDFSLDGDHILYLLRLMKRMGPGTLPIERAMRAFSWSSAGMLGLAALSSPTIRDAFHVLIKYGHMYIPVVDISVEMGKRESKVAISLLADFEEMNPAAIEIMMCAVRKVVGEMTEELPPFTLHFAHQPWVGLSVAEATEKYSAMLGCEVVFGSSFSGVSGPNRAWETPLKNPNKVTQSVAIEMLQKQDAANRSNRTLGERVRHILRQAAGDDVLLSLEDMAEVLHMSPRTVIRRLAKEELQFKTLVSEVRFERARHLLRTSDLAPSSIAYKVGYKNSNSFFRAFKNQTGMTPLQWRASAQGGSPS